MKGVDKLFDKVIESGVDIGGSMVIDKIADKTEEK